MFKVHRTFDLNTGLKGTTIAVVDNASETLVLYHNTLVVESLSDSDSDAKDTVVIRDGGWDTVSTRIVINRALSQLPGFEHFSLQRVKGVTHVCDGRGNSMPFKGHAFLTAYRNLSGRKLREVAHA